MSAAVVSGGKAHAGRQPDAGSPTQPCTLVAHPAHLERQLVHHTLSLELEVEELQAGVGVHAHVAVPAHPAAGQGRVGRGGLEVVRGRRKERRVAGHGKGTRQRRCEAWQQDNSRSA